MDPNVTERLAGGEVVGRKTGPQPTALSAYVTSIVQAMAGDVYRVERAARIEQRPFVESAAVEEALQSAVRASVIDGDELEGYRRDLLAELQARGPLRAALACAKSPAGWWWAHYGGSVALVLDADGREVERHQLPFTPLTPGERQRVVDDLASTDEHDGCAPADCVLYHNHRDGGCISEPPGDYEPPNRYVFDARDEHDPTL